MLMQEVTGRKAAAGELDYDRYRLRTFVDRLDGTELERRKEPSKLSAIAAALEANSRAVLFESAGIGGFPLIGNALGSRSRFAKAFGVSPHRLLPEILQRLRTKPEIIEVDHRSAPVQEIVATGSDVDLTKLPVHLQHGKDGGLYISAGMDFARDPATGLVNVGLRRFMLLGRATTGIDLVAPSDLQMIYRAALSRGERLPLSVVVGGHPVDYFGATMRMPGDELSLLACLRAAPMPVVKCVTNDLRVPADAEWVLEGHLGAEGYVEPEGPYGEFLGYYGGVKTNPIFHVAAITRRSDALFQTLTIGGTTMSCTDTAQLTMLRTEVLVWRALETSIREPVAVYAPPATGGVYNVRIAMRQRVPGEARNAIAAAFGSLANVKNVFVVDPDIDIFSDEQMEWALATRFQPDRDLVVASAFRTIPLDPSLPAHKSLGAKAGFDLTMPLGARQNLEAEIPQPPRYAGERFGSVEDALRHGAKFFEELMAAIGSEDGREIVLALEQLRQAGRLARDPADGRYSLLAPVTADRSRGCATESSRC
ncbi:MAG TPA: UbiD family decarboxylase [Xanthobacteraceae bacterium]|jgi:UbiD family decarboxylase